MKKKILAAVTAGVLAAATVLATPAQAATMEINQTSGTGITINLCTSVYDLDFPALALGTVCFQPEGDILQAHDKSADGHSIALRWVNYYQGARYREGACVESRQSGSVGTCNKNFHEGSTIVFKACLWENATNTQLRCGETRSPTA